MCEFIIFKIIHIVKIFPMCLVIRETGGFFLGILVSFITSTHLGCLIYISLTLHFMWFVCVLDSLKLLFESL